MTAESEAKLQDVVRSVLELPPNADVTVARQLAVERWDSLGHVSLMLAIEGEFGLNIDVADQLELTSYSALRRYLEDHGA